MNFTRFNILNNKNFLSARKLDAKQLLKKFKWDKETEHKLIIISKKGYLIEYKQIVTASMPLNKLKRNFTFEII